MTRWRARNGACRPSDQRLEVCRGPAPKAPMFVQIWGRLGHFWNEILGDPDFPPFRSDHSDQPTSNRSPPHDALLEAGGQGNVGARRPSMGHRGSASGACGPACMARLGRGALRQSRQAPPSCGTTSPALSPARDKHHDVCRTRITQTLASDDKDRWDRTLCRSNFQIVRAFGRVLVESGVAYGVPVSEDFS